MVRVRNRPLLKDSVYHAVSTEITWALSDNSLLQWNYSQKSRIPFEGNGTPKRSSFWFQSSSQHGALGAMEMQRGNWEGSYPQDQSLFTAVAVTFSFLHHAAFLLHSAGVWGENRGKAQLLTLQADPHPLLPADTQRHNTAQLLTKQGVFAYCTGHP